MIVMIAVLVEEGCSSENLIIIIITIATLTIIIIIINKLSWLLKKNAV